MLKPENLDLDLIASAMQDDGSMGLGYFLNKETGEVLITGFEDGPSVDPEDISEASYVRIAAIESYEAYQHMEGFTLTLAEGRARTELEQALIRRQPFECFKDVLGAHPDERRAWQDFKDEAMARIIARWLIEIGAITDHTEGLPRAGD